MEIGFWIRRKKMKITDITAIIAIVLSLINLGIVLKKEMFKPKPSLKFYIKMPKYDIGKEITA